MTTQTLLISTRNPEINHRTGILCRRTSDLKDDVYNLLCRAEGLTRMPLWQSDAFADELSNMFIGEGSLLSIRRCLCGWLQDLAAPGYVFDCYFVQGVPCWGWWPREG